MRKIFSILTSGSAAVALLTACFGSAQTPAPVLPDTVHGPVKHANNICGSPSARRGPIKRATNKYPPDLYVADNTLDQVDILRNGSYAELGYITNGINGVSDVFLDKNSNLYVANFAGGTVTEYAPSEPCIPSFTYSTNMGLPAAVTADAHNDVYEGDQESNAINEYYQDENSIVQSCYPGGKVFSVAVDAANDVFALISPRVRALLSSSSIKVAWVLHAAQERLM